MEPPTATDQCGKPKPKLRWYQYRLRTLLLVMTGFALWLGFWTDSVHKQQRAVESIRKSGGRVAYAYEARHKGAGEPTPPGPGWLRNLLGIDYLDDVVGVVLDKDGVSDADLEHLESLPRLEYLIVGGSGLGGTNITDAGLKHIRGLRRLYSLRLVGDKITDAGLAHLEGLHCLEWLELWGEKITDAGLVHLQSLRELQILWLWCSITDAGVEHLKPLTKLKRLSSRGSPADPIKKKIFAELHKPTQLNFFATPLLDVCEYLEDYHMIKLQIDDVALTDAKIDKFTGVTCRVNNLRLNKALSSILEPLGLGWHVGPAGLVITTGSVVAKRHAGLLRLQQALPNLKQVEVDW